MFFCAYWSPCSTLMLPRLLTDSEWRRPISWWPEAKLRLKMFHTEALSLCCTVCTVYHLVALVPAHLLNLWAILWPDLSGAIKRKFIHSCLHSNKWLGILRQLFFLHSRCKKTPPNCSSVAGCLPVSGRHVKKVHRIPLMSPTGPVYTAKVAAWYGHQHLTSRVASWEHCSAHMFLKGAVGRQDWLHTSYLANNLLV